MSKAIRYFQAGQYTFITQRCSEERHFLTPSPATNQCVGSWLARAQKKYKVDIIAYAVMSNHWHLIVRTTENNLSLFMAYLSGNVARDMNKLLGRHGDFWEDRYSAQPILDDESLLNRIEYVENNPVAAGLCYKPAEWCGLTSAKQSDECLEFKVLHRREWDRVSGRSEALKENYVHTYVLRLTRLTKYVAAKVMDFFDQDHNSRPKRPKRSKAPLCFAAVALWQAYKDFYKKFRKEHREASEKYRAGDRDVLFPNGSFRPPIPKVVGDGFAVRL